MSRNGDSDPAAPLIPVVQNQALQRGRPASEADIGVDTADPVLQFERRRQGAALEIRG